MVTLVAHNSSTPQWNKTPSSQKGHKANTYKLHQLISTLQSNWKTSFAILQLILSCISLKKLQTYEPVLSLPKTGVYKVIPYWAQFPSQKSFPCKTWKRKQNLDAAHTARSFHTKWCLITALTWPRNYQFRHYSKGCSP